MCQTCEEKENWRISEFPTENKGYYCADCEKSNKVQKCGCGRNCWKWCDECVGYRSLQHEDFQKYVKKKRSNWDVYDFPKNLDDEKCDYYCLDCKKNNEKRDCECGRTGWRWCWLCSCYCVIIHEHFFGLDTIHKRKKWNIRDFPSNKQHELFNYYCADCKKSSRIFKCGCKRICWKWCELCNGYRGNNTHDHKIKKNWDKSIFPSTKQHEKHQYYCANCKKSSRIRDCECKKRCWRWCESCNGYRNTVHKHFKKLRKKTQKKKWNLSDFPSTKQHKTHQFYCGDCKKSNVTRKCDCGRYCWKWCIKCSCYHYSTHDHFKNGKKRKRDFVVEKSNISDDKLKKKKKLKK